MIIDLTETIALCDKFKSLTKKSVSFDIEYFDHSYKSKEIIFKLWFFGAAEIRKFETLEELNHCIRLLIEENNEKNNC